MDFYNINVREIEKGPRKGEFEVYPDFVIGRSKDLMVRGRSFYAIWDEEAGLWSTDEYDVQRLVDEDLYRYAKQHPSEDGSLPHVKYLRSFNSNGWSQFRKFIQNISDNSHELDSELTFSNTEVKKSDYASRRLPYPLESGDYSAWDELIGTLYSVEERRKIEWAIGAIVSGDSKRIQKFLVLYGPAGTGKSTILNIVQTLFEGYTTTFEAKALAGSNNAFATEAFKDNPLVAIQHDGDLSRIEDNTKLNSIISHEDMTMNEKYKASYTSRVNAFLFMGTNQPVKISDAKSGIIRRLIDVHPTGVKIPPNRYNALISQVDFELGAIAKHCQDVYFEHGKNYYNGYRPTEMMLQTDVFFNFIEANFDLFKAQDHTTLKQAYILYKEFCDETGIEKPLAQYKFREELRNYFDEFHDRGEVEGERVRSLYSGFTATAFKAPAEEANTFSLVMDETVSIFDELFATAPAQGAKPDGTPLLRWADVHTVLGDLETNTEHYVQIPENHVIIDFDLTDEAGKKSAERNLEAASAWPATYAEFSKSGAGIHLHYNYDGDTSELASIYSEGIEVKVYRGNASLRRKLTKCNNVPVATINSGLPIKEKSVLQDKTIQTEKGLRELIARNLRKEIHPGTKPSIDFIHKILEDAYSEGLVYDVTDLRPKILAFANNSTNQSLQALKMVQRMKFQSAASAEDTEDVTPTDSRIVFFDVEVYPNLFVVCWKYEGDADLVKMINPSPAEIENLFKLKLVGFNNRRYDNHILYARYMGYDNERLFKLSMKIVSNDKQALFGEAYNLSYADIYDFSSKKQGLKKFEIELGIKHMEMGLPWDEPAPEDRWDEIVEYCCNDVVATEAVFEARKQDFVARKILADLSGLSVNSTTQKHTAKILFEGDRRAQDKFVYTDLSKEFPGYEFDKGKSFYKGEEPGEGGYVYAEPGIYEDVAVLDIASMHPTSIEVLDLFGPYTKKFSDLKAARIAIKRRQYKEAAKMLDGKLVPYLQDETDAAELSYALKIVINIVYGLTSAKFDNPFRDIRNRDNIVAKRGALFMIDLKNEVQAQGFTVAHIKTDSIKIPKATPEIIEFVTEFGKKYGYDFEHEATYDKMALVNEAVYIAREGDEWHAVGAQFQHPYVYKTLFTGEGLVDTDICETKQVTKGSMCLDFEYDKPMGLENPRALHYVGRTGRFVPVEPDCGGAILYRVNEDKHYAVTGTKGHFWVEADMFFANREEYVLDTSYFEGLVSDAKKAIEKFGSFDEFVS